MEKPDDTEKEKEAAKTSEDAANTSQIAGGIPDQGLKKPIKILVRTESQQHLVGKSAEHVLGMAQDPRRVEIPALEVLPAGTQ